MCGLGEFFEVLGILPVQTAQTDVGQPLQGCFSHVAALGVCSLQQSLHRNTQLDLIYCLVKPCLPAFLWCLRFLNILGTSCLCVKCRGAQLV